MKYWHIRVQGNSVEQKWIISVNIRFKYVKWEKQAATWNHLKFYKANIFYIWVWFCFCHVCIYLCVCESIKMRIRRPTPSSVAVVPRNGRKGSNGGSCQAEGLWLYLEPSNCLCLLIKKILQFYFHNLFTTINFDKRRGANVWKV